MSEPSKGASSEDQNEENQIGPFAVTPKYDCPHLGERSYILVNMTQQEETQQPPCNDCGQTQENWICAHDNCQYIGCSRYQQKHMLNHHQSTGHKICFSLSDKSVFCYACDSYIAVLVVFNTKPSTDN